jgi:hypothetical protein
VAPAVWIGLVVVAVGGLIWLAVAMEKKRREALEQFCMMRGFTFERERKDGWRPYQAAVPLFDNGGRRRWGYTIAGRVGKRPFTAFEYAYTVSSGKNSQTYKFRVMCWETGDKKLPAFSISPEGFWKRLGQKLGRQDIDFNDDPTFSEAYELRGPDEDAIRDAFTPRIRGVLGGTPGQNAASSGTHLFWWKSGRLPKPDDLDPFFMEGESIARVFLE